MQHCMKDKECLTLKMKIDKEQREKSEQEKIEQKYEKFYYYLTYKNEERVQLKKRINDEMFEREKDRLRNKE